MSVRFHGVRCVFAATVFGSLAFAQNPVTPAAAQVQAASQPINGHSRLQWLFVENLGLGSLLDDVAVGAVDTGFNTPKEDKTHWSGFGERTGMIAANYGVKSTMEAGLGSIWGEDPRYLPTVGLSMKSRIAYVVKMTFLARDRAGNAMLAYSRYIAYPASSFLSNEWQPTSQATANQAALRVGFGFLSRMGENAGKNL